MKKISLVLIGCLSLTAFTFSMSFSLKLTGGAALITGGDYGAGVEGLNDFYAHRYQNVDGAFSGISLGPDFGLEIMVNFTERIGVGFGVGSLSMSRGPESVRYDWMLFSTTIQDTMTLKTSVSTVPITLNFHYGIPLGALRLDVFGGVGYYPSRMKVESGYETTFLGVTSDLVFTSNSMKGQFGVQAGLGLEVPIGHRLAFILDVAGRYVSLRDIKGDYTLHGSLLGVSITKSGTDYYYYIYDHFYGGATYKMLTWTADASKPSGGIDSGARHAHFDLTGVTAQAGFKFRF